MNCNYSSRETCVYRLQIDVTAHINVWRVLCIIVKTTGKKIRGFFVFVESAYKTTIPNRAKQSLWKCVLARVVSTSRLFSLLSSVVSIHFFLFISIYKYAYFCMRHTMYGINMCRTIGAYSIFFLFKKGLFYVLARICRKRILWLNKLLYNVYGVWLNELLYLI